MIARRPHPRRSASIAGVFAIAVAVGASSACADLLGIEPLVDDPLDGSSIDTTGTLNDAAFGIGDETASDPRRTDSGRAGDSAAQLDGGASPLPTDAALQDARDARPPAPDPARGCTSADGRPVSVFPSITALPVGITIDPSYIFVADSSGVRRCGIEGCDGGVMLLQTSSAKALAEASHVIFSDNSRLYMMTSDGFVLKSLLATGATVLAAHDRDVYFGDGTSLNHAADDDAGVVHLLAEDGGAIVAASGTSHYVFAIRNGEDGVGQVIRCAAPACAGGPTVMATVSGRGAILADDRAVYWSDITADAIYTCDVRGCGDAGPHAIATNIVAASLFLDDTSIYWATLADHGVIGKALRDGGAPKLVANDEHFPKSLVANGACVYWTTSGFIGANLPGDVRATRQP